MIFLPFIVIALSFITDFYTWQGIKTIGNYFANESLAYYLRFIFWSLAILVPTGLIVGFASAKFSTEQNLILRIFVNVFFAYTAAKLSFGVFLLAEDLFRLLFASFKFLFAESGLRSFTFISRNIILSSLGFLSFLLMIGVFVHAVFVNSYNFKIHNIKIEFEHLPASFDGFKIVQFSDFHAGSHSNIKKLTKGIELLNSLDADVLVFTGDMVNHKADEFEEFSDVFNEINPEFGKFSILGNHDYGDYVRWENESDKEENVQKLIELQTKAGFKVLLNENTIITKGNDSIFIAGVENWGHKFVKKGDLPKALVGIPDEAFVVLLSHDPSHWDLEVKNNLKRIDLTLSGHTHGFQFGIETKWFKWSPVQYVYKEWSGLSEHNGIYRYINRGFGFIGLEGRVGIRPEISVIELVSLSKL